MGKGAAGKQKMACLIFPSFTAMPGIHTSSMAIVINIPIICSQICLCDLVCSNDNHKSSNSTCCNTAVWHFKKLLNLQRERPSGVGIDFILGISC